MSLVWGTVMFIGWILRCWFFSHYEQDNFSKSLLNAYDWFGTSSFCIRWQWGVSISYTIFFCLNSVTEHAFSGGLYNFFSLYVLKFACQSQMLLPLPKGLTVFNFLREIKGASIFLLYNTLIYIHISSCGGLGSIFFFQKSVHICYSFWNRLSACTGCGLCTKQLLHISYEVLWWRCVWARKAEYRKKKPA